MKQIEQIFVQYKESINEIDPSNLNELSKLKEYISLSKKCIHNFSLLFRSNDDISKKSEINFFKHQKPYVKGRLKYFTKLHSFIQECPKGNIEKQRKYIHKELNTLEKHKAKQLEFFNYYKHNERYLDDIYFVRGNNQFDLFIDTSYYYDDPEFSTIHDYMATKIVAYDLLTLFFEKQLKDLKMKEKQQYTEQKFLSTTNKLTWTGSKTDLVELIFALHAAGVFQNGNAEISKIAKAFEYIFNIELGNIHKTFAEICARENDQTKFLDKLKISLLKRIEKDNENS